MLTKFRRWLTKSSEGARGLGDRVVEDDVDMCRPRARGVAVSLGDLGLKITSGRFLRFGPQNPVRVLVGMGGGT